MGEVTLFVYCSRCTHTFSEHRFNGQCFRCDCPHWTARIEAE